jgi:membrane fusion protein (multidrug efflux system)
LNTLSDIDPIRVRFSISEQEYLILARTYLETSGGRDNRRETLEDDPDRLESRKEDLVLILADGTRHKYRGSVIASSQAIDSSTGTYTVEASFPNPNDLLLPGQFARVKAPYQTLENVVTVPRKALTEQQGIFRVFVVSSENIVENRAVKLGPMKGLDVVIESGLTGGESVIVEGLQKVRAGMTVSPTAAAPAADTAPLNET